MKPLSEQSRRYLERYKAEIEPSQLHIARQRRAVLRRIAEADAAGPVTPAPPPTRRARRLAFAALLTLGAAAAAVLLMFGLREFVDLRVEHALRSSQASFSSEPPGAQRASRHTQGRSPGSRRRSGGEAPSAAPVEPAPELTAGVESEVDAEVEAEPEPGVDRDAAITGEAPADSSQAPKRARRRRAQRAARASSPASTPSVTDLQAESALLARARVALSAGDTTRARALLASHERRHPDGLLAEERVVLQALTHCRAGDHDAGRAALRQLRRAFPGSLAISRVSAACR